MELLDTSKYDQMVESVKGSENPREALASMMNRMSGDNVGAFLRYFAGWQTAAFYANHHWKTDGSDVAFNELASCLGVA